MRRGIEIQAVGQNKAQSISSSFFPSHVFPPLPLSLSFLFLSPPSAQQPYSTPRPDSAEKFGKKKPLFPAFSTFTAFFADQYQKSQRGTEEEDDYEAAKSEGHRCPLKNPSLMRSEQPTPPPPWERKYRKLERGGSGSGSSTGDAPPGASGSASAPVSTSQWRDLRYGGPVVRDSPRCPPSGLNRIYPEDSPSRSERPYTEDERRHGRDNRNPFRCSPTFNAPSVFPTHSSYDTSKVTATRSLSIPVSTTSTTQHSSKGHTDSKDHWLAPISWKPLKWARPSSGSSSCKEEATLKVLVPPVKETPVVSPVTSPLVGDEIGTFRKKARLGWGQGLAKYEKEKVQGSVDSSATRSGGPGDAGNNGAFDVGIVGTGDAGTSMHVIAASCSSPVTPLSATSRPPDEKQCTAVANTDGNTSHQIVAESANRPCSRDLPIKLDFSVNSVNSLSTLLANLLQPEDACTGDSTFMYKVSMLKVDLSKELEKTETEIDSLELELKSLDSETKLAEAHQGEAPLPSPKISEPCSLDLELESLDSETKPVEAHQAQAPLPTVKMSEHCSETTKDCKILDTEEMVACSEKQEDMLVDLKIKNHAGQEIYRCSDEPNTSNDNDLVLDEAKVLINSIISANKGAAKLAAQSIGIAQCAVDIWESVKVACSRTDKLRIREKLAVRKRQMKFKEQVLALKFMVLKQLWKEDMRLLKMNNFTKSGKRVSVSSVPLQCLSQKPRSSVRARLPSPDDNSSLVPSTEILEYSCKLLSSSEIKQYRSYQKMPLMIIDSKEKENRRFPTKNGLIGDPVFFERDRSMLNLWTPEEKEVFMEMLATFGKDFTKISTFLDHKTAADCVEFYYKNHKSESFAEVRKRLLMKKKESHLKLQQLAQSSTFLMATSRKWSRDLNAAALDILGAASVIAECNQTAGSKAKQKVFGCKSQGYNSAVDRKESMVANVPSSIGRAVSSEAMSSCVTTSTDPTGKTSHVRPVVEEDACSEESCGDELVSADWTDEEKALFVQAYNTHGKDFSKISLHLGTRSRDQCKVFFCKAQKSLGLDFSNHGEGNGDAGGTLLGNGDTNNERSDTDDGVAEMDSGICSTQSCSKVTGDVATTCEAVAKPEIENLNDRTSEQEVVGGAVVKSEMHDCFPGKQETVSIGDGYTDLNEKLVPEEGKPAAEAVQGESENALLTCNGEESLSEVKEKIDPEVMIEQSRMECVDADSVPALHTTGTCSTYQYVDVGKRPTDTLKERVSLAHSVAQLHQTGTARSRRRASIDLGVTSSVISFASDSGVSESLLSKPDFETGYLSQVPLKSFPVTPKENNVNSRSVHFGSGITSSSSGSICFSGTQHGLTQTTLNFEEHLSKPHHNVPERNNLLQQYMQKNTPLVNQTSQSSHVLKGYPLQMPNHKGTRNETEIFSHVKRSEFPQPNQFFGLNASNARYSPVTEIMTAPKRDDKFEVSVPPASQPVCSTENDAPCRTGDVKLFGKILNQSASENVCSRPPPPMPNSKESSSMQSGRILSVQNGHSLSTPLFSRPVGFNVGNQLGLVAVQAHSNGFWDRNSVRPGLPILPESACMIAKYQDSLAGVLPFYPGKDSDGSNVHANLSNNQQAHMQQLASNGGRVDGFSMTVPKRSGIEVAQQLAPNMVGAGAGFIRAGGVVSDPVVALKMLYSSNSTVCSNGSGTEAWSDVGR